MKNNFFKFAPKRLISRLTVKQKSQYETPFRRTLSLMPFGTAIVYSWGDLWLHSSFPMGATLSDEATCIPATTVVDTSG